MPLADYRCPACRTRVEDVRFPLAAGAVASAPPCPACGDPRMEWIPQAAFDLKSDGGTGQGFQKFSVDLDGRPVEIDSLHTLRRVERESEQRYRNGEGEPLRFRAWSQDRSNREVGSFGREGRMGDHTYADGSPLRRSGRVGITRHGQEAPEVPLGPGLADAAAGVPEA